MSLKLGNEYSKKGLYKEALEEYRKIDKGSPLFPYAEFNIRLLEKTMKRGNGAANGAVSTSVDTLAVGEHPLLSIVMPVFNVAPYLDTSIVSALSQRYQNFELIIVNDASTDNSKRIINMYEAQDPRIRFIDLNHNTLGGAGIPSNIGIRAAKGEYVAFIDSDDWVSPGAFAHMMEQAVRHNADVVIGTFCTFTDDERVVSPAYDAVAWGKIPKNEPISLKDCPDLLRLSPVPWRKIYKREFLNRHGIEYPEGDYFYEDNPLHWFVLSRAERVVLTEDLVSYHRMAREGQTMSSALYKLSAICCHINTIFNAIKPLQGARREILFKEFYDYCYRCDWIVQKQEQESAKNLIKKRWAKIVRRAEREFPLKTERAAFPKRIAEYEKSYPDMDLTIVIPVYNSADLVRDSINSILKIKGLKFDVLAIDDGSTDESLQVIREYEAKHKNIHVFSQGNKGAGRARNSVIPMCTGAYTFFLDADDVVDGIALEKAVAQARRDRNDLLFFKYRIEFYEDKKSRGMFNADEDIWKQLPECKTNVERQEALAKLINYPWNRIIQTQLLHDANIFFGSTVVHNDIPYHWHSIMAAHNIGYSNEAVCTHRKFSARSQITNISDGRRLAVLEALRFTHSITKNYERSLGIQNSWLKFSGDLLKWAEERIPPELLDTYRSQSQTLLSIMEHT